MRARAARHHDDASPIKLVSLLAALDPAEKRGFVHPQRQLNIHRRLIGGRYSNPRAMETRRLAARIGRSEIRDRRQRYSRISFHSIGATLPHNPGEIAGQALPFSSDISSSRRVRCQFPLRRQIDKAEPVADHFRFYFYEFNPPGDRREQ
jgi:hypothetical protein